MFKHTKSRVAARRPTTFSADIVAGLRAKILDGTFTAGQRLPTYAEIEKQFRSTPPTVAKALDILKRDGFIRSELGRGLFVTERPPHRHHYALAMAARQAEHLSQFYTALRIEAGHFEEWGRHFSIFYGIAGHTDTEDYQRLLGFVRSRRLAGLIFAEEPYQIEGSPLLEEPGIPRVAIATEARHAGMPAVSVDLDAFLPKALDHLVARGCRRVALMTVATGMPRQERTEDFVQAATARGMTCRPHWIHAVHANATRWAHNVARLLMEPRERPDGLVILDDNVVESATAGIAASGVHVPRDITIVAHTNFPWPTPSAVPVRRLGYDVRRLLELCVERIDAQRRGEQPPPITLLPPFFEDELNITQPGAGAVATR